MTFGTLNAEPWFGTGLKGGATVALSGGGVNVRLSKYCLTLTSWRREGNSRVSEERPDMVSSY